VSYTPRREAAPNQNIERRPALLLTRDSRSASVRFRDGSTYSLPAALFAKHDVKPGEQFMLVRQYAGKRLLNVHIEPIAPASSIERKALPKIQIRSVNGRLTTRQG
jgi:hypothetical protein